MTAAGTAVGSSTAQRRPPAISTSDETERAMFETGIRQFRMAMGMVWGRKLDTTNLARLVDDALRHPRRVRRARRGRAAAAGRPARRPGRPGRVRQPQPAPDRPPAGRPVAVLRPPIRRRRDRPRTSWTSRRCARIPVTVKRDLIERPGRLPVRRLRPLPGHPHHRHHRPAGRDLAVPVRDRPAGPGWARWPACCATRSAPSDIIQVNVSSRATAVGAPERRGLPAGRRRLPGARHRAAGRGAGQPDRRRRDAAVDRPQLPRPSW